MPSLERRRRHHRPQFAVLEPVFRLESQRAGEASVVRQHRVFAQAFGKRVRYALRQAPRIDEYQRSAVRADQIGYAVIDLRPHLVSGHRAQFVLRNFNREVHRAAVPDLNDARPFAEELRNLFDGFDRCGESDALRFPALHQRIQARERESQVRAAFVVGQGMDFVHDHCSRRAQHAP